MERQSIIILTKGDLTEAWGSFTECCKAHGFPYHSLKAKKYPFEHGGWHFKKVSFRALDMEIDYFKEENKVTKKLFDLDEIISFQMEHDVQIIREADWQYVCYIDERGFGSALTTMGALVIGIKQFKDHSLNGG